MKKTEYILSIDIGTSSSKGILASTNGKILRSDTEPYNVIFKNDGRVEQDPEEVFNKVLILANRLLANKGVKPADLLGVVIDGILHSLIPVDKDGAPLTSALLWADTRSSEQSRRIRDLLQNEEIKYRTGCSIHPLYYPSRLLWFKENNQNIFNKSFKFLSIKEYIIKKLTGKYIIDKSTASGTGLFNIHTEKWDKDLLKFIGIEEDKLSEIHEPTHIIKITNLKYFKTLDQFSEIPLIIGSSDGPMAHLGSSGLNPNNLSLTVGSSCAMRKLIKKSKVLKGKEAWCYYLASGYWLLGGVAHDGGIIFQWLNENIFSAKNENKIDLSRLNNAVMDIPIGSDGLFFLPYLSGERTPNYNPNPRGAIFGISYKHTWKHLMRSAMEGIGYRIYTIYKMLSKGGEYSIALTGGIIHQPKWMEIVSGFLNKKLLLPEIESVSAWGSFLLALSSFGIINLKDIDKFINYRTSITPDQNMVDEYNKLKNAYKKLYYKLYP